MEIETKKIKTPIGGHEVEIKEWITGRERRYINSAYLANQKVSPSDPNSKIEFDIDTITKAQDFALETVIISIDGIKENILDKLLDMRAEDFDFINNMVQEIVGGKKEEDIKKK